MNELIFKSGFKNAAADTLSRGEERGEAKKKIIFKTALVLFIALQLVKVDGQVIFSEDFHQGIPGSFTLVKNDTLNPNPAVAFVDDAWVAAADDRDSSNTVAVSTSWYFPEACCADDWLITPQISVGPSGVLSWRAKAVYPNFRDGYEVRISTAGDSIADFLANQPLLVVDEEEAAWTVHQVDLQAAGYANQNVYLAFRNVSDRKALLAVDDIDVGNLLNTDAKVLSVQGPSSSCGLSSDEAITVTVENMGLSSISNFPVTYLLDDGDTVITVTETAPTTLAKLDTYTYTFIQGADLSTAGATYDLKAFVSVAGDADNSNDTLTGQAITNIQPYNLSSAYTSGFESTGETLGWSVDDANNDGFTWVLNSIFSSPRSGSESYTYEWNQDDVTPADDWLFSTCIDLQKDTIYELSFWSVVGQTFIVWPEKLEVKYGMAPDVAGMTETLTDLGELTNSSYKNQNVSFIPTVTGTYHFGFHAYSNNSTSEGFFLSIDDVMVRKLPPPVASFDFTNDSLAVTFVSTSTNHPDSLSWDFGDGNTGSGESVTHTYANQGTYYVCLTASNLAGSDTYCDTITSDTVHVGINDAVDADAEISLYPNPAQDEVTVDLKFNAEKDVQLYIRDMLGKAVFYKQAKNLIQEKIVVDLSSYPQGLYFLDLRFDKQVVQKKFILAR